MKAVSEDKLQAFLAVSSGYGDGSGDGYGYGSGSGSGYGSGSGSGDGYGYGSGYGYGYGDGSGDGSGDGITFFCGMAVHMIDDTATIITAIFGNSAKGYILESDLTLTPCYIAKSGNKFAHGATLADAVHDLQEKLFEDMDEDEVIAEFWACHERGVKYPARDFYDWHHRLTGSCKMGRDSFVAGHGIDLEHGMYTVEEFIALTRDSYGGAVIARLEEEEMEHERTTD